MLHSSGLSCLGQVVFHKKGQVVLVTDFLYCTRHLSYVMALNTQNIPVNQGIIFIFAKEKMNDKLIVTYLNVLLRMQVNKTK